MAADIKGSTYYVGQFKGVVDFDPGNGKYSVTNYRRGEDVFILKLDSSGNLAWIKSMKGVVDSDYSFGTGLVLDGDANIYITGFFSGEFDFDPSSDFNNLTSVGIRDGFLAKFNKHGNLVWVNSFGGKNIVESNSISLDASGNIITIGYYHDSVDFDSGKDNFILNGWHDVFIQKTKQITSNIKNDLKSLSVVYPNPVNGNLSILISDDNNSVKQLRLTDLNGKIVHQASFKDRFISINMNPFPSGAYVLIVSSPEKNYIVSKIIKY